ncbi:MAG TPA: GNAT family N-acetyltransferase [Thermoplasmata archaeon]|nr:GNAT family N-acetyltransferase [Thermoplasmata archaeon]
MTDRAEILALYDREMRRDPVAPAGSRVERLDRIVRLVGEEDGILWSDLSEADAPAVVAEQLRFFGLRPGPLEWKVFGHDRPAELEALLARAGFVPGEPETLVVFDLRDGPPSGEMPDGVEVRRATDAIGLRDAVRAGEAAFGADGGATASRYAKALRDPRQALLVAYTDGAPVAAGRLEMPPGRSFASLWGGGTDPRHRHRGLYRGLVRARGAIARAAGYRFLTVDAEETSRPILLRLGFVPLTTTRAWTRPPSSGAGPLD